MTYYELFTKAENLLNRNEITLGEYEEMVEPLNEEIQKEGEWNFIGWNQFECTCCHYPYTQDQLRAVTTRNDQIFPHFCPNCGARMKGE